MNEKCYTFNLPFIPNEKIDEFQIYIKPTIFGGKMKPDKNQFSVSFHYPYQKSKSLSTEAGWKSKFNISRFYRRKYYVANIELLKRRNKANYPCIQERYDQQLIQETIEAIGCKPMDIKQGNETKFCKTDSFLYSTEVLQLVEYGRLFYELSP